MAVGSYSTRRQRIAQTATIDVTDPPQGTQSPSKFVSHFSPGREAEREVPSHGKETAWKSKPLRQYPTARQLAHWQAMWTSAFREGLLGAAQVL